jgi:hypothetical protein
MRMKRSTIFQLFLMKNKMGDLAISRSSMRRSWFTPVILATQEAGIRRLVVQSQLWANSLRDPI